MTQVQGVRADGLRQRIIDTISSFTSALDELNADESVVDNLWWIEGVEQIGYHMSALSDEFCVSDVTEGYYTPVDD